MSDVTKVDVGQRDVDEKQIVISSGAVKFIVGCTESEEEEFNAEINRQKGGGNRDNCSVDTTIAAIQRSNVIGFSNDRKRMQSECSSGVSTRFSCSESNNVSSRSSIVSGLSSGSDLDDAPDRDSFSHDSLLGRKNHFKKMASMDVAIFASTTNEGFVVSAPPPLTRRLVVNPVPSVEIIWSYEIVHDILVANAPTSIHKTRGINDALVTLLEYGENDLHCSRAVILVERDNAEKDSMLRMFSFLGFTQLEPRATPPSLRSYITQYILMVTDFSELQDNDSDDFDFDD